MATTKVTTPDGKVFNVTHKEGATKGQITDYINNVAYPTEALKEKGAFDFSIDALALTGGRSIQGTAGAVEGIQKQVGNLLRNSINYYHDYIRASAALFGDLDGKTDAELAAARDEQLRGVDIYEELGRDKLSPIQKAGEAIENSRYLEQDTASANFALDVLGTIGYFSPVVASAFATRGVSLPTLLTVGQSTTEAVEDMERTLGKEVFDFTQEEKNDLAGVSTIYGLTSAVLAQLPFRAFGFGKLSPDTFRKFLQGKVKVPAKPLYNTLKAGAAEMLEESGQKALLDSLAKFSYDDDRELVGREALNEYKHQAAVAFFAGGAIRGGGEVMQAIGGIKVPTPERKALSEDKRANVKPFTVNYVTIEQEVGREDNVVDQETVVYAENLQEAEKIANKTLEKLPNIDKSSLKISELVEQKVEEDPMLTEEPPMGTETESLTEEPIDTTTELGKKAAELRSKRKQMEADAVDPQQTGAEIPIGVFGAVDLDQVEGLTSQQKKKIEGIREEARQEANKLLIALADPTGTLDEQAVKEGLEALDDPTGAVDTKAVEEGLKALREISEEGTVGARKIDPKTIETFDKIREMERRQAEVFREEYVPSTNEQLLRRLELTIIDRGPRTTSGSIRLNIVGARDIENTLEEDITPQGEVVEDIVSSDTVSETEPVVGARKVNIPNAPVIKRSLLKKLSGFFYFSDRTRVGTYTGLDPNSGISIPLQGGPAYAFIKKNLDQLAGWAFTSEGIFTKFRDKVNRTNGLGFITLYKKENLRANGTFLKAYVAEVNYAIDKGTLTLDTFLTLANTAREQVLNLSSKNKKTGKTTFTVKRDGKGYSLFSKPFKSVADFEAAMDAGGFEVRGRMLEVKDKVKTIKGVKTKVPGELSGSRLASATNIKKGLPDVIKMIDLFTEPDLADRERGEVIGAVQFEKGQKSSTTADKLGVDEHLSYPLIIKGKGIGVFENPVNILNVLKIQKKKNEALRSAETSMPEGTVGARPIQTDQQRGVIGNAINQTQVVAEKIGVKVEARNDIDRPAQYNYETQTIQYNPEILAQGGKDVAEAVMREEVIHSAMHKVIMKRFPKLSAKASFEKAMSDIGSALDEEQKTLLRQAYGDLDSDVDLGAEYSRFAVQHIFDGKTTEGTMFRGKAYQKIKSLIRSVQSYLTNIMGPELKTNKDAAFIIADTVRLLKAVDPDRKPVHQKFVNQAAAVLAGTAEVDSYVFTEPFISSEEEIKREKDRVRRNRARIFQTASSFFERIHPKIRRLISNHYDFIMRAEENAFRTINNFQTGIKGIKNKSDKSKIKKLLLSTINPNTEKGQKLIKERDTLLIKYNLLNDFNLLVRPLLDRLRINGTSSGLDIKYLFEYFPRRVKDLDGLLNFYGKDIRNDFNTRIESLNAERKADNKLELNKDEIQAEFLEYWRTQQYLQASKVPGFLQKRTADNLSEKELSFYEEPEVALGQYVSSLIVKTAESRLLGSSALKNVKMDNLDGQSIGRISLADPNGELSALVAELYSNGELPRSKMGDLFFGLDQMFGPAKNKSENEFAEIGRIASYGTLLVDPTTTLSQLYDLAFISLDNNVARVIKTIFSEKDFTLEMAGIDPTMMSAEFQSKPEGKRKFLRRVSQFQQNIVKKGLRLSQFTRMDQLMKETNLTTNYNRFKRLAKLSENNSNFKKLKTELEFMVGEDADRVIADLRNDVHNSPYVREVVVRKLLETQPVTKFEMPMAVANDPNMRMWYTMKSFVIKQLNLVNDRMIQKLRRGSIREKKEAIKDLATLLLFFLMAGIPIDFLKDMIAGRSVYPEDYVENAFLRLFGMSKYNLYIAREKGVADALGNYFAPVPLAQVVGIINEATGFSFRKLSGEEDTGGRLSAEILKYIPFNDVWYYRYGPGAESQQKRFTRERKEKSRLPMIESGEPIDVDEIRDIIPYLRNL